MISTHILDTSKGLPAAGVEVKLQKQTSVGWDDISSGKTDIDGRFSFPAEKNPGVYKLTFEIENYLKKDNPDFFFLQAPVIFKISNVNRKYHVPLLLNPFGYSTYRGS